MTTKAISPFSLDYVSQLKPERKQPFKRVVLTQPPVNARSNIASVDEGKAARLRKANI